MKRSRRAALAIAALAGVPALLVALPAGPASAHGSLSNPPSRSYACWKEGPETPKSAGCKALVAAAGTQALYDWHEVNLANAAGNHKALIPDGQLCSAGRSKYRGLDLPRADFPATKISAGNQTFTYDATAPHRNGNFTFYITRSGWSPTQPLNWGDLVQIASFNRSPDFSWTVNVPARAGRALIYSIWQRTDSPEAFYTCSDVDFGGATGEPPAPPQPAPTTPAPSASPLPPAPSSGPRPPAPPQSGGSWKPNTAYPVGAKVTFDGRTYTCRQAHTTLTGWEPPVVPALWLPA